MVAKAAIFLCFNKGLEEIKKYRAPGTLSLGVILFFYLNVTVVGKVDSIKIGRAKSLSEAGSDRVADPIRYGSFMIVNIKRMSVTGIENC